MTYTLTPRADIGTLEGRTFEDMTRMLGLLESA